MNFVYLLVFFSVLFGCDPKGNDKDIRKSFPTKPTLKEQLLYVSAIDSSKINIEEAKKHTPEEAELIFGKPIEREVFIVDGALPEFRIEIYNYISEEEYNKERIEINEVTWKKVVT